MTRYVEPPPKSPSRLPGKCGRARSWPRCVQGAAEREVGEVVAGGVRRAGRPGPSRSSGRRPAAGCGPGSRSGRGPGVPSYRGAGPRRGRRRARRGRARWRSASGCLRSRATLGRPRLSRSAVPGGEHRAARPVDPDHVGAEVGQDHAGVRPRPDARELDDPHAPQRPASPAPARTPCAHHDTAEVECGRRVGVRSAGASAVRRSGAARRRVRARRGGRGGGTAGCAPRGGR